MKKPASVAELVMPTVTVSTCARAQSPTKKPAKNMIESTPWAPAPRIILDRLCHRCKSIILPSLEAADRIDFRHSPVCARGRGCQLVKRSRMRYGHGWRRLDRPTMEMRYDFGQRHDDSGLPNRSSSQLVSAPA